MAGGAELSRYLVLLVLAACQGAILYRAWITSRGDDYPRMRELNARFADDLVGRARRGQGPDWLRYRAELDRLFEARDDRLRSFAAAALAAGLGATLIALVVTLGGQAARQRLAAQLPIDDKRKRATWIIDNSGDEAAAQRAVDAWWDANIVSRPG